MSQSFCLGTTEYGDSRISAEELQGGNLVGIRALGIAEPLVILMPPVFSTARIKEFNS